MSTEEMEKEGVTFGANSTAKSRVNRQHTELGGLLRTIENAERQVMELRQRCCHHFVAPDFYPLRFTRKKAESIYDAGTMGCTGRSSEKFILTCSKCNHAEETSLVERCPLCAGEIDGGRSEIERPGDYFLEPSSHGLWRGGCIECNLHFAALIHPS